MLAGKRIAFVGPGVMGEAIIAGLLHKKLTTPQNIIACGPEADRGEELTRKYAISFSLTNQPAS
jgi:pyrroline-5-carboxylate reductase